MKTYEEFKAKMNDLLDKITSDWEKGKVDHAESLSKKVTKLSEKYPEWDIKYDEEMSEACGEMFKTFRKGLKI